MRTHVAIIGAGPAGMLLSHLLAADGVDSVIVEARTEQYVLSRIRAGILEHSSVELLRSVGLGDRLSHKGIEHRGICPSDALVTRIRLQAHWLAISRTDPLLPKSLLPRDWPAQPAEELFRRLDIELAAAYGQDDTYVEIIDLV